MGGRVKTRESWKSEKHQPKGLNIRFPDWKCGAVSRGHQIDNVLQRDVSCGAGVQFFRMVDKFNQVTVSLAQLVAN